MARPASPIRRSPNAPMGRAASPEDIAELASLMIGSGYLTGEILMADGGYNLT